MIGQQIDGHHALVCPVHPQHGRIVSRAQPQKRVGRQPLAEPGDKTRFHSDAITGDSNLPVVCSQFWIMATPGMRGGNNRVWRVPAGGYNLGETTAPSG